jgi:hypothetical protein
MTPPKDRKPPAEPEPPPPGATLRRLLRAFGGAQLWHVEEPRKPGQKWPVIRYEVAAGNDIRRFERPQEAWRHFQQLSHAPDKDTRPEPPPLETPPPGASSRPRKVRRRRKPS